MADTTREPGAPGDPLRGVSVAYLASGFLQAMGVDDDSDARVYNIEPKIRAQSEQVCPRDKQHGAAFVDVAPDPDAGRATFMLSYGWGYRVIDIVRALEAYCDRSGLDRREVRVWASTEQRPFTAGGVWAGAARGDGRRRKLQRAGSARQVDRGEPARRHLQHAHRRD